MFFSAIDDGIALLKRARSGFETTQDAERARDVVYLLAMWVVRRLLYVTMRVRFQPVSNQFFSYQINTNARVLDFYSKTSGRCQNKTYLPESLPQYLSLCKRTWKQTALKPRSWKDGSGADDALVVSLRSAETPPTLALPPHCEGRWTFLAVDRMSEPVASVGLTAVLSLSFGKKTKTRLSFLMFHVHMLHLKTCSPKRKTEWACVWCQTAWCGSSFVTPVFGTVVIRSPLKIIFFC